MTYAFIAAIVIIIGGFLFVFYRLFGATLKSFQDFQSETIKEHKYLLDRIQTQDPIVAHNLNTPIIKTPEKSFANFPTVDGVLLEDANANFK